MLSNTRRPDTLPTTALGTFLGVFRDPWIVLNTGDLNTGSQRGIPIADTITIGSVTLTLDAYLATITLNRPNNGNRIDTEMAFSLGESCRLISENDRLRLLVLTAAGEVFSIENPGEDHEESHGEQGEEETVESTESKIAALKIPVLVALNGDATGPGLELALAGDLRICVPSARFGFSGLAKGILPQDGGTQRLPRLVGPSWARDMLLTGRMVDAAEALAIGLVNRVADQPRNLGQIVSEIAAQITGGSPIGAIRQRGRWQGSGPILRPGSETGSRPERYTAIHIGQGRRVKIVLRQTGP